MKPDQLPENKQHHEIVREHDAEHGEHEERERGEVTRLAFVIAHVAERVDVDERADAGDEDEHGLAQLIEGETERDVEHARDVDPGELSCGDFGSRKMKQLQAKLPRTAATEMKLLNVFDRRVKSVITAAEQSGRSKTYHGSALFMSI